MLQRVFELYSNLLDYPEESFIQNVLRLEHELHAHGNTELVLKKLKAFKHAVEPLSLGEMQETHTRTFDLKPICSPHVGYHLFGESYKRGSLMAELKREYQTYGLQEGSEIPDHLSLMLKYLSVLSSREMEQELYEELLTLCIRPGLEKMVSSFAETQNPYGYLLESLLTCVTEHGLSNNVEVDSRV